MNGSLESLRNPGLLELRAELAGQWSDAKAQAADYTAAIEALSQQNPEPAADLMRLYARRGHAHVALRQWQQAEGDYARIVTDATTDDSLLSNQAPAQANVLLERRPAAISVTDDPVRLTHEQRVSVARSITDPWSKLAAANRLHGDQPAIDKLAERRPQAAAAIGDLFAADEEWERSIEIYSRAISKQTTDALLLSKRARAYEALKNWDGAAADWSRATTGNPEGAKLLAEFARRLAAGGQVVLATGQFEKARALYERSLDADPENDVVATELAQLLLNVYEAGPATRKRGAKRFADVADPWSKLAAAYAINRRNDLASEYFGRALHRADGYKARKPIVELVAQFDDVLSVLAQRRPDDPQWQLALARKLAERGKKRLAEKQPAEAIAELGRSREIFTRLRPEPKWTVLTPTGAESAAGTTLPGGVRLAVTNEADPLARAAVRRDLEDSEVVDLSVALAKAQTQRGHINEGVASFTEALDLAKDRFDKARIIATAAALAAAAQSQDVSASPLDDAARARLRCQALDWMRAELTAWTKLVESAPPQDRWNQDRLTIALALSRWQEDSDLAGVRGEAALAKLPAEQRKAFTQFWADAAELLRRADGGFRVLPAAQQIEEVRKELEKRNPGFDGSMTHKIEGGVVTELLINGKNVTDLSPVRSLVSLKVLSCTGGPLSDVSPLKGMPLTWLNLDDTQARDLSPLTGMPLTRLELKSTQVSDLEPLKGMSLTSLSLWGCSRVRDLKPLKGMPLTRLNLYNCQVQDLEPLEGMPLTSLFLAACSQVDDLTPLEGMPLTHLNLDNTQVANLESLKGMPLTELSVWKCHRLKDVEPLKGMPLTSLGLGECHQLKHLEPLKGMPLKALRIENTGVSDLKPLQDMLLESILLTTKNITEGLDILRDMSSLKTIGNAFEQSLPPVEFWETERMKRFPAVLRGEDKPADNAERLSFARIAYNQKKLAFATRLWAEALSSDPKIGDDRRAQPRYSAARAAALAAAGQGKDEPPLDEAAKAKLRRQALDWLKAELTGWTKLFESGPPQDRPTVARALAHWRQDGDLAGIRNAEALARLPEAEQKEWRCSGRKSRPFTPRPSRSLGGRTKIALHKFGTYGSRGFMPRCSGRKCAARLGSGRPGRVALRISDHREGQAAASDRRRCR